jgi:hypothetical protein
MMQRGWHVEFITWQSFSEAIYSNIGEDWERLCSVDVVMGGADFDGDYMLDIPLSCRRKELMPPQESQKWLWF